MTCTDKGGLSAGADPIPQSRRQRAEYFTGSSGFPGRASRRAPG
ncbi:hypothetical protein [Streptosporangium roseum]|nr:hypothetical protein [Streptosporangium roseum]